MIASYKNDTAKGPGYGLLEISEVPFDGNCSFSLVRASDHTYLSADGWKTARSDLTTSAQSDKKGLLKLSISPAIVAHLNAQENYRITLMPADGSGKAYSAPLQVKNIIYAPEERTDSLIETPPISDPALPGAVVPPPPAAEPAHSEPDPSTTPIPPVIPLNVNNDPPRRVIPPIWLLAGVPLLLAFACAVLWFFLRETPTAKEGASVPEKVSAEPAKAAAPDTSGGSAARPSTRNTDSQSVEARINEFLSKPDRKPEDAALLGSSIQANTPEEQDALYRLYYYLTENGNTSFLLPYAACHDPSKPQWGTIEKDAVYAMQIYNKASGPEAEAARESLRAWVKREAERDPKARVWQQNLP